MAGASTRRELAKDDLDEPRSVRIGRRRGFPDEGSSRMES